jgi:hypothetical protein
MVAKPRQTPFAMRIDPRFSTLPLASATPRRSVGGQEFSLDEAGTSRRSGAAAASAPLSTLDALLAVQGEGDPRERRRRTLKRGHDLLASLDRLKAAILSGSISSGQLQQLAAQVAAKDGSSGDPGLDEVLAHIELRAKVEIAKLARVSS